SNNTATYDGGGIIVYGGRFAKTSISADGKSGVIYGSSAGEGLANTAGRSGAAICVGEGTQVRNDTLGQFDEY
ncbi:MAG: hypothetical protein LBB83_09990, partial [Treponema sp.]|nr:hypothetical protein [Treponema sp.]